MSRIQVSDLPTVNTVSSNSRVLVIDTTAASSNTVTMTLNNFANALAPFLTLASGGIPDAPATNAAFVRINSTWVLGNTFFATKTHTHSTTHITSGVFDATRGGTGLSSFVAGRFFRAANATHMELRSAEQVRTDIGAAPVTHTHTDADIIGTIRTYKIAREGADPGQALIWNGSAWAPGSITSANAVTSIDISGGTTGLTTTGGPVTNSGTITLGGVLLGTAGGTGLANLVAGAYLRGANATHAELRTPAQVRADIQAAAATHTHDAADIVSGVLPLDRGGTGATSAADARANLGLGNAATRNVGTSAGTVAAGDDARIVNAVQTSRQIATGIGLTGGGNLTTDRTIELTGQARAIHTLASNGYVVRVDANTFATRTIVGGTNISVVNGDGISGNTVISVTGLAAVATSGSASDLTIGSLALARLAQGGASTGQVLRWNGTQWAPATPAEGTVTSVALSGGSTGLTVSGSPITTSGTMTLGGVLAATSGGTGLSSFTAGNFLRAANATHLEQRTPTQVRADIDAAATTHTHDAADITSGTLPAARGGTGISSFTAGNFLRAANTTHLEQRTPTQVRSDIGAAPTTHTHDAADITSGTFTASRGGTGLSSFTTGNFLRAANSTHLEQRTPAQVRADIDAAPTVHAHSTSDITSGTFTSARGGTGLSSFTTGNFFRAANATHMEERTPAQVLSDIGAVATTRQIVAGAGLSGGGDLSADRTISLAGQVLALHNLSTNGFVARTGAGTLAARSLTAGSNISITNGDGVSGNPVISVTGLAAVATSGSASDLTTGSLALARLAQGGATVGQVLKWNGTQWAPANDETGGGGGGGGGGGTVTSVGLSGGDTGLTVSGSPITTSGTMTLGGVLAATSGGTGLSSYTAGNFLRAANATHLEQRTPTQVRSDIGAAAATHTHDAADIVSGTLPAVRGGTGLSSFTAGNFLRAANATHLEQRTPTQVRTDIDAAATIHTHSAADITSGTFTAPRGGTGLSSFTTGNFFRAANATHMEERTPAQVRDDIGAVSTARQIATGTGLTGGGNLTADRTISLTGQALALHNLSANGLVVRAGADTILARSLVAGTNIAITNPDGVAGNPTISVTGLAAVATSGSASDLTTGALALTRLAQGGATTGQVLKWNGTQWAPANDETGGGGGGGGTVTSVGLSGGSTGLTVSGSPITTSGTMTLGGVLAATSGGTGLSSYTAGNFLRAANSTHLEQRTPAQVRTDIDAAPTTHTHSAADITSGTLPAIRGGTGLSSFTTGNFFRAANATHIEERTPAQVRTDIGAAATSHTHDTADITSGTFTASRGGTGLSSFTAGNFFRAANATHMEQRTPAQVRTDIDAAPTVHTHSAADITSGTFTATRGGTGLTSFTAGNFFRAANATHMEERTPAQVLSDIGAAPVTRQIASGPGLSGGGNLTADRTLELTGQARALHDLTTNGLVVRSGAGSIVARTLAAGSNISITNPDGVAGNPTISVTGLAAVATSGSASDLTTGSLALARLAQGGATTGQVLKWNGTQWAPANDETGGGGGGGGTTHRPFWMNSLVWAGIDLNTFIGTNTFTILEHTCPTIGGLDTSIIPHIHHFGGQKFGVTIVGLPTALQSGMNGLCFGSFGLHTTTAGAQNSWGFGTSASGNDGLRLNTTAVNFFVIALFALEAAADATNDYHIKIGFGQLEQNRTPGASNEEPCIFLTHERNLNGGRFSIVYRTAGGFGPVTTIDTGVSVPSTPTWLLAAIAVTPNQIQYRITGMSTHQTVNVTWSATSMYSAVASYRRIAGSANRRLFFQRLIHGIVHPV